MLELIAIKTLMHGVYNYSLWERLYTLSDKNLLIIKHVMNNYNWLEEASVTRQNHPRFQI